MLALHGLTAKRHAFTANVDDVKRNEVCGKYSNILIVILPPKNLYLYVKSCIQKYEFCEYFPV